MSPAVPMADTRILEIILRARDEASKVMGKVADSSDGLTGVIKRNYKEAGLAAGALIGSLSLITKAAISNAASYEQNRIAFESMLGSAARARTLLSQVSDFAKKTPFELPEVVEGAKRLLAYNIEAKKIIPTFKMLGDIAAGVGTDKLPQLITAFGQVQAKGRLMGQELLQFTEAGVGLGQQLQKQFGVTREELEKMISSGDVTAEQVTQALQSMTSQGGLFFNGMERQAGSFNGIMSNIRDVFGKFAREVAGISENGDIRQGSLFYYLKQGAEKLLPILEAAIPKVSHFIEMILANKEIVIGIAGAIGGLLVLALVALIATFGTAILVMAGVAAAGALVAVTISRLIDWFRQIAPTVMAAWNATRDFFDRMVADARAKFEAIKNAFKQAFDQLPGIAKTALAGIAREVLAFNPVIKVGLQLPDIVGAFNGLKARAREIGIPGFADGGWVGGTGLALVHQGEFVLSRDMLAGREPIPGGVVTNNRSATVTIGPVYVQNDNDIQSMAQRMDFYLKTSGTL